MLLGIERSMLSVHIEQSTTAMKSIFLKDYVPPDTLLPVTRDHPDMAIYTTCRLDNMINHAVDQVSYIYNQSITVYKNHCSSTDVIFYEMFNCKQFRHDVWKVHATNSPNLTSSVQAGIL